MSKTVLVIHGGAGTILRKNMTDEMEVVYRTVMEESLRAGYAVLRAGGKAVLAVEAAIRVMEDSPSFNAGRGSVFSHDEQVEMDASVMDGATLEAGAVAAVKTIRNPISAAIKVLQASDHVLLTGAGAQDFAAGQGLEMEDPSYFHTQIRLSQLHRLQKLDQISLDHDGGDQGSGKQSGGKQGSGESRSGDRGGSGQGSRDQGSGDPGSVPSQEIEFDDNWKGNEEENGDQKFGTVGAVALDQSGHLVAGTSTGGMTNKKYGRIGDSPIIGSGTYANNATCGVSATGHGEFFMRGVIAHDISAMMEYKGLSVQDAAGAAIEKVAKLGGSGGVICLDAKGNVAMPFNTEGMYRGTIDADGVVEIGIFRD